MEARKKKADAIKTSAEAKKIRALKLLVDALGRFISGDLAKALIFVAESIRADGNNALAHAYQGSFNYLTHNRHQAVASWRRALALDPKNSELRQVLSTVTGQAPKKPVNKQPGKANN